jgi:hypothetical protein
VERVEHLFCDYTLKGAFAHWLPIRAGELELLQNLLGDFGVWGACGAIVWLVALTAERRRQSRRTPRVLGGLLG